jgi:hypothetical protein
MSKSEGKSIIRAGVVRLSRYSGRRTGSGRRFTVIGSEQSSDYSCVTPNSSWDKDFQLVRARSIWLRHT